MRLGETPVPIPNTTVKTQSADGTALETVWESRWAPDQKKKNWITTAGGDALRGHTRSHPEHDG